VSPSDQEMPIDQDIRDWLEEVRGRFKQLIEMDDKELLEHIRSDGRITLPAFVRKYRGETE
jgi:hypothetical protein